MARIHRLRAPGIINQRQFPGGSPAGNCVQLEFWRPREQLTCPSGWQTDSAAFKRARVAQTNTPGLNSRTRYRVMLTYRVLLT